MTTNWPAGFDDLDDLTEQSRETDHVERHNTAQDGIQAMQASLGLPSSSTVAGDTTEDRINSVFATSTKSVNVGTTTTGAAGTNAEVDNSGTDQDLILDFTIPAGASTLPNVVEGGILGSVQTLSLSQSSTTWLVGTMNADLTVTLTDTGPGLSARLLLTQDSTGNHALTVVLGSGSTPVTVNLTPGSGTVVDISTPDGTIIWVEVGGIAPNPLVGFCGDASDGPVTLDGTTTYVGLMTTTGAAPNLVYTMTRPANATTFIVSPGITVNTAGYPILATVLVNNAGTIQCNGGAGTALGVGGVSSSTNGLYCCPIAGGAGQTTVGTAGSYGNTSGPAGVVGTGGAGGLGPNGAGGIAAGLAGGISISFFKGLAWTSNGCTVIGQQARAVSGGANGGGGGGDNVNKGGGGGAGGGVIVIISPSITNSGVIAANGGNGGSPTTGNTGGGGAGGGGFIVTFSATAWINTGSTSVVGGSPGTGFGSGANGGTAGSGHVLNVVI